MLSLGIRGRLSLLGLKRESNASCVGGAGGGSGFLFVPVGMTIKQGQKHIRHITTEWKRHFGNHYCCDQCILKIDSDTHL